MKTMHINPWEAVQIHQELYARRSLAIRWGTFPLTAEPPGAPTVALAEARRAAALKEDVFQTPPLGATTRITHGARPREGVEKTAKPTAPLCAP